MIGSLLPKCERTPNESSGGEQLEAKGVDLNGEGRVMKVADVTESAESPELGLQVVGKMW